MEAIGLASGLGGKSFPVVRQAQSLLLSTTVLNNKLSVLTIATKLEYAHTSYYLKATWSLAVHQPRLTITDVVLAHHFLLKFMMLKSLY